MDLQHVKVIAQDKVPNAEPDNYEENSRPAIILEKRHDALVDSPCPGLKVAGENFIERQVRYWRTPLNPAGQPSHVGPRAQINNGEQQHDGQAGRHPAAYLQIAKAQKWAAEFFAKSSLHPEDANGGEDCDAENRAE